MITECPSCHTRLEAPDEYEGERGKCENCGIHFTIHAISEQPSQSAPAPVPQQVPPPQAQQPAAPPPAPARPRPSGMTIITECPHCGETARIPVEKSGDLMQCAGCGQNFIARKKDQQRPKSPVTRNTPAKRAPRNRYAAPIAKTLLNVCGLLSALIGAIFCFCAAMNTMWQLMPSIRGGAVWPYIVAAAVAVPVGAVCGAFWYGLSAIIRLLVQISEQLDEQN